MRISTAMDCELKLERELLVFEDLSLKFKTNARDFNRQYAHVYASRFAKLEPILQEQVVKKWGKGVIVRKLADLETDEQVVVIGTVYKQQELKPNILREISDEHQVLPLPPNSRYISATDSLILEDDLQRVALAGNLPPGEYVTGVVLGLLGSKNDAGKFVVEKVCSADMPLTKPQRINYTGKRYVALMSGLEIGSGQDRLLDIQEMVYALMGKSGSPEIQEMMSQISRVIIAGNSLSSATQDRNILDKAKYLLKNNMAASIEAVQLLDDIVYQLCSSIPVDLMPGSQDPANFVLPQQPLHRCMLPNSYRLSTLQLRTNPFSCRIAGRLIMGTSGQPVKDIMKNCNLEDPLDVLQKTLEWRHVCPTAPDTLGCYPYMGEDPFIFDACPDVYFAGNQESFSDRLWTSSEGQSVRLVSVPRFSQTSTVVLVDLDSFECQALSFHNQDL